MLVCLNGTFIPFEDARLPITDDGLPALEGLRSLEDLKVTRTAVTAEGVEQLHAGCESDVGRV